MANNNSSILIIEDDEDLLAIIKRAIESEGYDVDCVKSAEDAYALLTYKAFSLIVLDINLPGDDGIGFCRQLRSVSMTPVIFASARVEDDARALALESGGDAFLSKPFSLRELLAQIKAVENRLNAKPYIRDMNGLVLDIGSRQVLKNGVRVELSPKEFELVSALMRKPDIAIPKGQLIADIWGAFSDVEPQTLAVHMRWIREKLEDDPAHPVMFETVRGFGYRFVSTGQKSKEESRLV